MKISFSIVFFIYFSKICSKLHKDYSAALLLKTEEKEESFSQMIAKFDVKLKKMEEEWRLALGDFGSTNSRERKKIEKSFLLFSEGLEGYKEGEKERRRRVEEGVVGISEKQNEEGKKVRNEGKSGEMRVIFFFPKRNLAVTGGRLFG